MNNNKNGLIIVGFAIGIVFSLLLRGYINLPSNDEKEVAVKEYIQHPENFKVYQIKDDTIVVDIRVEYLK